MDNPFDITRAVDFDDRQINEYWVDLPGGAGFTQLVKPTSAMPMLILGGKGSGKTHLLRYFSFQLQRLRHHHVEAGIATEGFVGVYLRCGGLNSSRFAGKRQTDEKWTALFQQYMDLWLGQLYLDVLVAAMPSGEIDRVERAFCEAAAELFDAQDLNASSLPSLRSTLRAWQRDLDTAINNAALTGTLEAEIKSSPGRLVFGLPRIASEVLPSMRSVQSLYLIDELENLDANQQKYINTLVREREGPCSFKVGARLYGIKTYETYSAGEVNREGSEYEKLLLDDHLRENSAYPQFARLMCERRLKESHYLPQASTGSDAALRHTMRLFFADASDPLKEPDRFLVRARQSRSSKPHLEKLEGRLREGMRRKLALGVNSDADVSAVLAAVQNEQAPLLEKVNVLLLYQEWSEGRHLVEAARSIGAECRRHVEEPQKPSRYKRKLSHFGGDMAAQLLAEYEMQQQYTGFETFVAMSRGVPRSLLVVLKHIFQWSLFNGEKPFRGVPITVSSQQQGVMEAARWFFRDAEVLGLHGVAVQDAIRRLADLLRAIRFSDKPAECSLSTFSVHLTDLPERTRQRLDLAEKWSLLLRIGAGQKDRNSRRMTAKYQLNSMLVPLWDLPVARRGAIALGAHEVKAIFDPESEAEYSAVVRARVARMTAPAFKEDAARSNVDLPLLP